MLSRKLGERQQCLSLLTWPRWRSCARMPPARSAGGAGRLESREPYWIGWSLNHSGQRRSSAANMAEPPSLHQRSLTVFYRQLGERSTGVMWAIRVWARPRSGRQIGDRAVNAARRSSLSHELGAQIMIAWCLAGLGSAGCIGRSARACGAAVGRGRALRTMLVCLPAPAARAIYERLLVRFARS